MRLFESIIDANHRAVAGDAKAGVHIADFENELPVIALTCVDPRLNALFPNVLGLPGEQFIWLRNAGNIIFSTTSTMMRTLAAFWLQQSTRASVTRPRGKGQDPGETAGT